MSLKIIRKRRLIQVEENTHNEVVGQKYSRTKKPKRVERYKQAGYLHALWVDEGVLSRGAKGKKKRHLQKTQRADLI